MYLDPEDKETIIKYLSDNKTHFKELKAVDTLEKIRTKMKKKFDSSFYDEIDLQFYNCCKLVIAEDISRNTGLASDGIMYILDYMGIDKFKEYWDVKRKRNYRRSKNSKSSEPSGSGSESN